MAYSVIQQGDTVEYDVMSVAVNTRTDINDLPTSWKSGSTAIVIEDSSVWMLSVQTDTNIKEWKEI